MPSLRHLRSTAVATLAMAAFLSVCAAAQCCPDKAAKAEKAASGCEHAGVCVPGEACKGGAGCGQGEDCSSCPFARSEKALERTADLVEEWDVALEDARAMSTEAREQRTAIIAKISKDAPAFTRVPTSLVALRDAVAKLGCEGEGCATKESCCKKAAAAGEPAEVAEETKLALGRLTSMIERRKALLDRAASVLDGACKTLVACDGEASAAGAAPSCCAQKAAAEEKTAENAAEKVAAGGCCAGKEAAAEKDPGIVLASLGRQWSESVEKGEDCGKSCAEVTAISGEFRKLESACPAARNLAETTAEVAALVELASEIDGLLAEAATANEAAFAALPAGRTARLASDRQRLHEARDLARGLAAGVGRISATKAAGSEKAEDAEKSSGCEKSTGAEKSSGCEKSTDVEKSSGCEKSTGAEKSGGCEKSTPSCHPQQ